MNMTPTKKKGKKGHGIFLTLSVACVSDLPRDMHGRKERREGRRHIYK